jgi:type IV pilus assembly protein PilM
MLGKKKSLVGLDVGSNEVKAIELTQVGDQLKITGFGHAPIPSKDGLRDAIAEVFRRSGIKTRRVATAVSGRAVIVRYNQHDEDGRRRAPQRLALRGRQVHIPFQVDEVVLDCARLPDFGEPTTPEAEKEMKVLLVAVKQTLIDEHLQAIQSLGLVPTLIDVDTFAMGNAFRAQPRFTVLASRMRRK